MSALADHSVAISFILAAIGILSGYVTPLLSFVMLCLGITWYILQIRKMVKDREDK